MFGLNKEQVEDIVDRKICESKRERTISGTLHHTPCPKMPVYVYAVVMNGKTQEIGTLCYEKGKKRFSDPYMGTYTYPICDTEFCGIGDALLWIEEHAKAIKKEGYTFDASVKAHLLKRVLDGSKDRKP